MKIYIIALLIAAAMACHARPKPDAGVALAFINGYTRVCAVPGTATADSIWVENSPQVTDGFKQRYRFILDSARKADPELGLDFDPIFDAQDFPDKGFSLASMDSTSGYLRVAGNDWKTFELVLKLAYVNNKWLVDGAGIINIPKEMRARRNI
jgi:hypothetical protein